MARRERSPCAHGTREVSTAWNPGGLRERLGGRIVDGQKGPEDARPWLGVGPEIGRNKKPACRRTFEPSGATHKLPKPGPLSGPAWFRRRRNGWNTRARGRLTVESSRLRSGEGGGYAPGAALRGDGVRRAGRSWRKRASGAAAALVLVSALQAISQASSSLFADGFESGNLSSWTGSSQMAIQQQVVHSGTWAARATSAGTPAYAYKTFGTSYQELYYRIFFDLVSNSTTVTLLRFRTASAATILSVGVKTTSKLFTTNPTTGTTAVGPSVTKGVWHELQVHVLVNGTSSHEDVWFDGTAVPALSRSDPVGTTPVGRIDLGDVATKRTFDVTFDDVAIDPSFIDPFVPSVPTGLAVSSYSNQEVDLSWNASSDNVGVTGYTIYRSDDGVNFNFTGTSTTTSYKDTSVAPSATYSYSVGAFDAAGNHSSQSLPVTVTTLAGPDTEKPAQPTGLSLTRVTASAVDLSWNVSSDNVAVTGYTIYRSGDGGVTYNPIGTSTTTSYKDTTVAPSATYGYSVDAFDGAGNHSLQSAPIVVTIPSGFTTPIRHVVIIYQENHSFDNVLGKLCAEIASGGITGHAPCDGATSGTLSTGQTIPIAPANDIVPPVDHSMAGQSRAIDAGKMDGFDLVGGCDATTGYACYAQYDPLVGPCGISGTATCIPNLAALAEKYVIADRTFEFSTSPSFGGHMVLGSATLDGFTGDNPKQSTFTTQAGPGWGCNSYKDTQWWDGATYVLEPSCIPDQAGNGPYRTSPVPYVPTIFDRVDAAGLSWRIYTSSDSGWAICPYFYECLGTSQAANMVGNSTVLTDAETGNLPSYAIVTPRGTNSQHNSFSMAIGDNWIGQVVQAIQSGPNWSSTAIFITYDDCGCFYDHVPPPQAGWGIRVPMVIVSPYAKAGYTDSASATYASMLAYTERVFSLAPLGSADQGAYDYANSFDYSQAPLTATPMLRTHVSAAERSYVAAHSSHEGAT